MFSSTPLKDSDEMPFGKHRGEKLGDVPAGYLMWCYTQRFVKDEYPQLYEYIKQNAKHLAEEKDEQEERFEQKNSLWDDRFDEY